MVFLYDIVFKVGHRLPVPQFVIDVLNRLKVTPSQLMSDAWSVLLEMLDFPMINLKGALEAFKDCFWRA